MVWRVDQQRVGKLCLLVAPLTNLGTTEPSVWGDRGVRELVDGTLTRAIGVIRLKHVSQLLTHVS